MNEVQEAVEKKPYVEPELVRQQRLQDVTEADCNVPVVGATG